MADPGFHLIRSAQEEATFSWLPKGNSNVPGLCAAKSRSCIQRTYDLMYVIAQLWVQLITVHA